MSQHYHTYPSVCRVARQVGQLSDTNQGWDQTEQCVRVMEHYVNAASPCLNIDKSALRSEAARAHQHPHGISPPVAWLTLHRKCLPFTTHYLLLSPWLLHTGPGSSCPKLPSWVDAEHTLAQKMDSRHAKKKLTRLYFCFHRFPDCCLCPETVEESGIAKLDWSE